MPNFFDIGFQCCVYGWKIFLLISAYLILFFFCFWKHRWKNNIGHTVSDGLQNQISETLLLKYSRWKLNVSYVLSTFDNSIKKIQVS